MRWPRVLVSLPLWLVLVAATSPTPSPPSASPTPAASATSSPTPSPAPSPSPTPPPTPTPTLAFLSLDVTAGPANTQITVNGGAFLPNEQMTLYWDTNNKVAGGANADGSGNFTTHVQPFPGDPAGVHKLCASVPPNPCATFTLTAATSPSPSASPTASPTESPSASPSSTATATPSPTPVATTLNGFDVISRPPFVFLPIAGAIAILLSVGYWIVSTVRRPKPLNVPASAVVHRASRPDYSAGFGAPPAVTPPKPRDSSAWADVFPTARSAAPLQAPEPPRLPAEPATTPQPEQAPPPDLPPAPETQAERPAELPPSTSPPPGPVDWDVHRPPDVGAGPDEPLDLPEPGDDW